jgi:ATP:corrinoid adenosyltransferase
MAKKLWMEITQMLAAKELKILVLDEAQLRKAARRSARWSLF